MLARAAALGAVCHGDCARIRLLREVGRIHAEDPVARLVGDPERVASDRALVRIGARDRENPLDRADAQHLLGDPDVLIQGDRVTHLRYRVDR